MAAVFIVMKKAEFQTLLLYLKNIAASHKNQSHYNGAIQLFLVYMYVVTYVPTSYNLRFSCS